MIKRGDYLIAGCPLSGVELVARSLGEEVEFGYDLSNLEWAKRSGLLRLSFVRDPFGWLDEVWSNRGSNRFLAGFLSRWAPDSLSFHRWEDWIFYVYGEEGVALWSEAFRSYLDWANFVMRYEDLSRMWDEVIGPLGGAFPKGGFGEIRYVNRRSCFGLRKLIWDKERFVAMEYGYIGF